MAQAEGQGNEVSFELLKNTQQIAEQAALKAKDFAMRSKIPANIPLIPSRGNGEQQKAPEIPPKRLHLKKIIDMPDVNNDESIPMPVPQRNQAQKPPPPVPQKPGNAPKVSRIHDKPVYPQIQQPNISHERVSQNTHLSAKNQNIVNILNSPLFQQRANQYKMQQQQMQQQQSQVICQQMKPHEDFGSEDALRGIERGLKNMEKAMQEQMQMRNMNFVEARKGTDIQFNPMEFKRSLGGSINSLDGQNMRVMGNMRLNFDGQNWNQVRGIERNISMDQMRLEAIQSSGPLKGIPLEMSQQQNMKHNIYRSLDRTLPLELQFSRHRQQQELDFLRQNQQNIISQRQQGLSREDVNLRRRSSHDETQFIMQQQQKQAIGNTKSIDNSGGI